MFAIKLGLFLFFFVEDFKIAGEAQNFKNMWRCFQAEIDSEDATPQMSPSIFMGLIFEKCISRHKSSWVQSAVVHKVFDDWRCW